jgi:hypothetical protein
MKMIAMSEVLGAIGLRWSLYEDEKEFLSPVVLLSLLSL